jgi:hypothetical protein
MRISHIGGNYVEEGIAAVNGKNFFIFLGPLFPAAAFAGFADGEGK